MCLLLGNLTLVYTIGMRLYVYLPVLPLSQYRCHDLLAIAEIPKVSSTDITA